MFKFYNISILFNIKSYSNNNHRTLCNSIIRFGAHMMVFESQKNKFHCLAWIYIWSNKSHYRRVHIWKQHTQAAPFRFKLYMFSNITKNAFDARTVHISFLFSIVPFFLLIRFIEIIGCCIIANRNIADNTVCVCVVCAYIIKFIDILEYVLTSQKWICRFFNKSKCFRKYFSCIE